MRQPYNHTFLKYGKVDIEEGSGMGKDLVRKLSPIRPKNLKLERIRVKNTLPMFTIQCGHPEGLLTRTETDGLTYGQETGDSTCFELC